MIISSFNFLSLIPNFSNAKWNDKKGEIKDYSCEISVIIWLISLSCLIRSYYIGIICMFNLLFLYFCMKGLTLLVLLLAPFNFGYGPVSEAPIPTINISRSVNSIC